VDVVCRNSPARLIVANDVTQKRRAEASERQTHKLETMRETAAMAAHQFRPLVSAITGQIKELKNCLTTPETCGSVEAMASAAQRMADLSNQMLRAGAQATIQISELDFERFLRALEPRIRRCIWHPITLEFNYAEEVGIIQVDCTLLEAVIFSLVENARDAMAVGGTLRLELSRISPGGDKDATSVNGGEFACLRIADTGTGITPEAQAHLFEPFFTTWQGGQRTGLGLASAYGAVKQLGGRMEVLTQPGAGTEFRLYFRCELKPKSAIAPQPVVSGPKTVLLIEPDERTRMVARAALEANGYRVIETDSAKVAQVVWPSRAAQVDLLVTDLNFTAGDSGRDLAELLRRRKPSLKVLFTGADKKNQTDRGSEELLGKPYTRAELLDSVHRCFVG